MRMGMVSTDERFHTCSATLNVFLDPPPPPLNRGVCENVSAGL